VTPEPLAAGEHVPNQNERYELFECEFNNKPLVGAAGYFILWRSSISHSHRSGVMETFYVVRSFAGTSQRLKRPTFRIAQASFYVCQYRSRFCGKLNCKKLKWALCTYQIKTLITWIAAREKIISTSRLMLLEYLVARKTLIQTAYSYKIWRNVKRSFSHVTISDDKSLKRKKKENYNNNNTNNDNNKYISTKVKKKKKKKTENTYASGISSTGFS